MVAPRGHPSGGRPAQGSLAGRRPARAAPLWGAPAPILVTDTAGVVRFANAAVVELLGRGATDLTGRPVLGIVLPDDRGLLARRMTAVSAGAPTLDLVVRLQARDRVVPCLVGGAAGGGDRGSVRLVWVLSRAGVGQGRLGPADISTVAQALARLTLGGHLDADPVQRLRQAASWCREVTGAGSEVGLVLRPGPGRELLASTSEVAQSWGRAQIDTGEGPVVGASGGLGVVRAVDLGLDPRFPALSAVVPSGHSAVSCPVSVDDAVAGALTVYDADPGLLRSDDVVLPSLAAGMSSIAAELSGAGDGVAG